VSQGKGFVVNNFTQQRLKAWQPILTPCWMICTFYVVGLTLLVIGAVLLSASSDIYECVQRYDQKGKLETTIQMTFSADECVGPKRHIDTIPGPVYVYYELSNFHQNYRTYVNSRSFAQLRGGVITDTDRLLTCKPWVSYKKKEDNEEKEIIYSPCGLIARSVFNDTYSFYQTNPTTGLRESVTVDDSLETLVFAMDRRSRYQRQEQYFESPFGGDERRYQNPRTNHTNVAQWLLVPGTYGAPQVFNESGQPLFPGGVADPHFIVWMRTAPLPNFRKMWGKLVLPGDELVLPIDVEIDNRYPVGGFGGAKKLVLSTANWQGGRDFFLAGAYFAFGALLFLLGLVFSCKYLRKPRPLGDVNYLHWVRK